MTALASAALVAAASVPAGEVAMQDAAPVVATPEQSVPAADQPVADQPASGQPASGQPASGQAVQSGSVMLPEPAFSAAPTSVPAEPPSLDQISQPQTPIVVSGERSAPQDPLRGVNEASYNAIQAVDGAVIAPLAVVYEKTLPAPVRKGLRSFLLNLTEPVVALNFLLQLKPGKAAETLGRFALNSTIGVAGLIDVAKKKPFNLPYRVNGFGYTFGYYGIGTGPYFFLPLVGPTTLRDVVGLGLDRFIMPFAVGGPLRHPAYVYGGFVVRSLDDRTEKDALFARIREESNPYASYRELYLKTRQAEIDALHGKADFQREGSVDLPPTAAVPAPEMPVTATSAQAPSPAQAQLTPTVVFVSEPIVQPLPAGNRR